MDTVARIDDDRGAILAADVGSQGYAILADTAPFIEWGTGSAEPLRIAGAGDGPGELKFPSSLAIVHDTVVVWDPSTGRLSRFGADGVSGTQTLPVVPGKTNLRLRGIGYGDPDRVGLVNGEIVIASYGQRVRQEFALWGLSLLRVRPDGSVDTLKTDGPTIEQLKQLNQDAQELVAVPLWAGCGAGFAAWDPVNSVLRRFGRELARGSVDTLRALSVPLSDSLIRINLRYQLNYLLEGRGPAPEPAVFDQMIESMFGSTHGPRPTYPDNSPAFVSMQCDQSGTVWLQHFSLTDAGSGMGRTWTLVDTAGTEREARLPDDFRVLKVGDAVIWGEQRGEEGQVYLVKLELPS
jgi:hypothetical protein